MTMPVQYNEISKPASRKAPHQPSNVWQIQSCKTKAITASIEPERMKTPLTSGWAGEHTSSGGFGVSPLSASGHPEVADRLPHERIVPFGGQGRGDLDEQADHGCEHGEKGPDPLGRGRSANGARTGHLGPSLRQPRLMCMVSMRESETFW